MSNNQAHSHNKPSKATPQQFQKNKESSLLDQQTYPQSSHQSQTPEACSLDSFTRQIQKFTNGSEKKYGHTPIGDLTFCQDPPNHTNQYQTSKQLSMSKKPPQKRPQTQIHKGHLLKAEQSSNTFFDVFKNTPNGAMQSNEMEDIIQINIRSFQSKFIRELNFKQNERFRKSRKRIQISEKEKTEVPEKKMNRTKKPYARKQMHEMWYNGIRIVSEFKNEILHGQTEVYYPNGAKFIGRYELGMRIYGMFDFFNGYVYTGGFLGDKFQGQGTMTLPNGKVYSGEWSTNQLVGKVEIKYPSGDVYYGEVKNFKKHGKGYLFFKSGQKFVGEFQNGNITGKGQYFIDEQCVGRGYWKNGELVQQCTSDDEFSIFDDMASYVSSRKSMKILSQPSQTKIKSKIVEQDEEDLVMDGVDDEPVNIHIRQNVQMISINDIDLRNSRGESMLKQKFQNQCYKKNIQREEKESNKNKQNICQQPNSKRQNTNKASSITSIDPPCPNNISQISCESSNSQIQTEQLMEICNDFNLLNSKKYDPCIETGPNKQSDGSQSSVSSLIRQTGKFKSIGSTLQSQYAGLLTTDSNG